MPKEDETGLTGAAASWELARELLPQNGRRLQIVKRRKRAFTSTDLTWIVERSFAGLGRNRRLSKDYEYTLQSSETMIDIATIRLLPASAVPILS
jgi:transposase